MAGRAAAIASGQCLDGILEWCYNAAGFNNLGLMQDDIIYEDENLKGDIRRLLKKLYHIRMFHINRALDLTVRTLILFKEQWTKYEEHQFYPELYLKEVIWERKEIEE
ncbi:cytochrome b-c1 complex subunit 7-like [Fukomys damarensis]|uniref:cytochrome b-c1 complex subunit 7-like n=1 Tax=Fukomys damarensis TaxID=885580 RepID=UPI0014555A8E|nr:cytochrome b-c1 complex subunit 7-like [Fukomys damarensis]